MSDWKNHAPLRLQKDDNMVDERAVERYAAEHPMKSLIVHGGPVVGVGLLFTLCCIGSIGVSAVSIFAILFVSVLFGFHPFNPFNMAAIRSAENSKSEDNICPESSSIYNCTNYEQTTFEKKLADAGVINILEVTTCKTVGCILCRPIRSAQKAENDIIEQQRRRERQREANRVQHEIRQRREKRALASDDRMLSKMSDKDSQRILDEHEKWSDVKAVFEDPWGKVKYEKRECRVRRCPNHGQKVVETWFRLCPDCLLVELKAKDKSDRLAKVAADEARRVAEKEEKERLFQERRKFTLSGISGLRPMAVPEGAVPSFLSGRDVDPLATHSFIVWKWTLDGKDTLYYKQPVVDDIYAITSEDGFYQSFHSITDVQTGEFLGDYVGNSDRFKSGGHLGWSGELNRGYGNSK